MKGRAFGIGIDCGLTVQPPGEAEFGSRPVEAGVLNEFYCREIRCPAIFQFRQDGVVKVVAGMAQNSERLVTLNGQNVVRKFGGINFFACGSGSCARVREKSCYGGMRVFLDRRFAQVRLLRWTRR
jgi:hypothetical protein